MVGTLVLDLLYMVAFSFINMLRLKEDRCLNSSFSFDIVGVPVLFKNLLSDLML